MDIIKVGFGNCLKEARKIKNLTQEKLAERVGINLRQLARIEAGESFVTSDTLQKICLVLGMSPRVLFDYDIQDSSLMTGSGNTVHFSVIRSGNLIQLIKEAQELSESQVEPQSKSQKFDINMKSMAQRLKKEIIVDEIQDGLVNCKKIYKPDGTVDIINESSANSEFNKLKDKISNISGDNKKIEFMNLAFEALHCPKALSELKILIKGIELSQG